MGDHTYNTDHGVFRIKKENIPACLAALNAEASRQDGNAVEASNIETAFELFSLGIGLSDEGDVIDVYLEDSHFPSVEEVLTKVIAPFVEPGSFLVFAFGGASGLWSVQYSTDLDTLTSPTPTVIGSIGDVVVVRQDDMLDILQTLKNAGLPLIFSHMSKKYGAGDAAE